MARWALSGLLGFALAGCAVDATGNLVSAVAVPGDWVAPARTLTLSNPQYVPVVDPPRITGTCMSTCPGNVWGPCIDRGCTGLLPGTLELQRYVQGRWSYVGAGGNYSCRRNSNPASCDFLSVHSVGRAVDLMIPMAGTDADNTLGDAVANWLIENAEYIGIQRVIWDGRYWNGSRVNNHFSDISDTLCGTRYCTDHHTNHIHAELSVDGANRRTRFFTQGPPPMTCPVVCYGTAAVRADCTFTDCAATGQVCVPDPPRCASAEPPQAVLNASATPPAATPLAGLLRYQPVPAARLFDTRTAADSTRLARSDGASSGPLGPMRTGTVTAFPGLPAGAQGVWLNLTAVPQSASGFLSAYPAGASTIASTVNFTAPTARANATALALGAGGGVTVRSSVDADVVADLTGAFASTGLGLRSSAPYRAADTRGAQPLAAGTRFAVDVRAPADARGVVASVAVLPRGGMGGFVRAFPCDAATPPTTNINHNGTDVTSNVVLSMLAGGQLCFESLVPVDLVVDVTGFLVETGELSLQLLTPLRVLDTRDASARYAGRVAAGQVLELPLASLPGLPADARAALVNVTSVGSTVGGFVTAFPCGGATPTTSNLNFAAGAVVASASVPALGAGSLCLVANQRTHLLVDLLGVWVPTPGAPPPDGGTAPPEDPEDPQMDTPDGAVSTDASAPRDGAPSDALRGDGGPGVGGPGACGCHAPGRTTRSLPGALALGLGLALSRRRRARRGR